MPSILYSIASVSLLFASQCQALVPRASLPPKFSIDSLGRAESNYANVYRDGQGGGVVNGHDVMMFCDTTTLNDDGSMIGFTSNSIAFVRILPGHYIYPVELTANTIG